MGIIGWIILGLLAGIVARAITPGDRPGGGVVTTIVGIAGALAAGFVARGLGLGDPIDEFFDVSTWVAAIIGAVALLAIWGAVAANTGGRRRLLR
ncbi:MAG: GlsB/YeaQ/YmgE family stress response membrane protein [Actinomycetota bacterium]